MTGRLARTQWGIAALVSMLSVGWVAAPAWAADGPYAGLNIGASSPTNSNYRAHVDWGATANPYGGYMLNDYLGLQAEVHALFQTLDNTPRRNFPGENQTTSLIGITAGPRVSLPFTDTIELYGVAEGGGFQGISGRMNHLSTGLSFGGGLDYYLTPQVALSFYGRWNRAYQSPRPIQLTGLRPDQQGPHDATWAVGGIGVKYMFNGPPAKPAPPPPPPAVAQAPGPVPEKKKIVLRGVNFDTDKATIRKDAAGILDAAVATLKEEGAVDVLVVGHTDSRGSEIHNQKLSERRAEAVKAYLVAHGIAASRLKAKGMGESQPVASNDTTEGMAQNRRVELVVE